MEEKEVVQPWGDEPDSWVSRFLVSSPIKESFDFVTGFCLRCPPYSAINRIPAWALETIGGVCVLRGGGRWGSPSWDPGVGEGDFGSAQGILLPV